MTEKVKRVDEEINKIHENKIMCNLTAANHYSNALLEAIRHDKRKRGINYVTLMHVQGESNSLVSISRETVRNFQIDEVCAHV